PATTTSAGTSTPNASIATPPTPSAPPTSSSTTPTRTAPPSSADPSSRPAGTAHPTACAASSPPTARPPNGSTACSPVVEEGALAPVTKPGERCGTTSHKTRPWGGHHQVVIQPVLNMARRDAVDSHDPP